MGKEENSNVVRNRLGQIQIQHFKQRPAAWTPCLFRAVQSCGPRNSISFPDQLIPKPEPPFIQLYRYFAKSFTCIISINLKLALWAGVTRPQFTEEETEDPKVYKRRGDRAEFQPRCTSLS